jgi:methionine synthase I (cobalamin-dependent)/5,10-methylenetetrahydrofolate reductase
MTQASKPHLLERMKQAPLIFDGAMGTMLYQRGVFLNTCYDEQCLSNPKLVLQIHQDYVEAGAEAIETNTFGANHIKLQAFGLADQAEQINHQAVRLARQAGGENVYVVGSVGACTRPDQVFTSEYAAQAEAAFAEQIAALLAEGADAIILETFSNLPELLLGAKVARTAGAIVIASFTVNQEGVTAVGTPVETMVDGLRADDNVDVVGLNCGTGPAGAYDALQTILPKAGKPVVVMPNAGYPRQVGGRMLYLTSPEYFTTYAKHFIEMGVRGVGGCCGTTPEHIRMMSKAVRTLPQVKKYVEIRVHEAAPERAVHVIPTEQKSALAKSLMSGRKVTSVELLPPRSADLTKMLQKVRRCAEAGIDAINIPDGPRASARMSPMITAVMVQEECGVETILHYCCRDRNLIGMQSDLLGGYAAGLRNFLIITGDPPKLGDYPDATGVFDVDSIGLTRMASNLNHGWDVGGQPVDPPTGIFIGVGANPCAVDLEREIDRYFKKLDAGAEFAITQPVFDVGALLRFLDTVEVYPKRIPVIAGVWPLLSFKNAEFMSNEVPGVVVPDQILERMAKCQTKEEARAEGIRIARETIGKIRDRVSGFQVSAPLGMVEIALAVLEK